LSRVSPDPHRTHGDGMAVPVDFSSAAGLFAPARQGEAAASREAIPESRLRTIVRCTCFFKLL